jgi:peptide subunit release factor 1 (eRF1)
MGLIRVTAASLAAARAAAAAKARAFARIRSELFERRDTAVGPLAGEASIRPEVRAAEKRVGNIFSP